jgi:hypothetical protein
MTDGVRKVRINPQCVAKLATHSHGATERAKGFMVKKGPKGAGVLVTLTESSESMCQSGGSARYYIFLEHTVKHSHAGLA